MKKIYCTAFFLFFVFLQPSFAAPGDVKTLKGRLGLGFTNQVASTADGTIPALSAKYYLSHSFATAIATGFDTRNNASTLALGLKLFKNVFYEPNLIFYLGGGIAYVNRTGSNLQGSMFLGSEFFFSQLPSLGFSFEAGIRGDNTTGSFAIRTTGDSFLTAGMHFYF
jgi:hypothetical protein